MSTEDKYWKFYDYIIDYKLYQATEDERIQFLTNNQEVMKELPLLLKWYRIESDKIRTRLMNFYVKEDMENVVWFLMCCRPQFEEFKSTLDPEGYLLEYRANFVPRDKKGQKCFFQWLLEQYAKNENEKKKPENLNLSTV